MKDFRDHLPIAQCFATAQVVGPVERLRPRERQNARIREIVRVHRLAQSLRFSQQRKKAKAPDEIRDSCNIFVRTQSYTNVGRNTVQLIPNLAQSLAGSLLRLSQAAATRRSSGLLELALLNTLVEPKPITRRT